ncbi:heterokaryon incompatibility protein-domain-containing protein [Fusarium flagelliforme]|uniref:heterokaryon incompatibility protein-domain-containing protein n=1 Tax=Fusarium flagelliforme TaxID=2675880 RepID=UPI001E8D1883|nr:heterokaryon incompatibility protein-domain-containing protein [Fusarium flagelliforme]KAH7174124.1 heterokaryon incompatibility protein-domain-containing protein [Fusarium flagelliforme]
MSHAPAAETSPVTALTIRDWLSTCLSCHTTTCISSQHGAISNNGGLSKKESWRPSWLIDVQNRCVVRGTVEGEYYALSYTWADDSNERERLELLGNNIDSLTSANSLNQHIHQLSKAIVDAIELTAAIGTRYLWVDRLCIVQDDPHKATEFMDMDRIYSGAALTIVAAADFGLYLSPEDSIQTTEVKALRMKGRPAHKVVRTYYQALARSDWATRAWTYQEHILSRRAVFFLGYLIFWQCEGAVWDSDQLRPGQREAGDLHGKDTSDPSTSLFIRHMETPSWPDFSLYADLICPYNGRELSHQEDGLYACLGVLNRLQPAYPDGFIFGLPRVYLDHALLWQPLKCRYTSPDPPMENSCKLFDGCKGRTGPSTRRSTLPSWAWCGWQCFVDPKVFQAAMNINKPGPYREDASSSWRLKSTTNWECTSPDLEHADQQGEDLTQGPSPPSPNGKYLPLTSSLITAWTSCTTLFPAATLEIRIKPYVTKRTAFMDSSVNPVLSEKPLNEMPKVVVLQDSIGRFSGLLRITDSTAVVAQGKMTIVAMSQGTASGKDLGDCFEEKVFRRSRYYNPKPFRAEYDENDRWVGSSPELSHRGEENYRVLAVGDYNEILELSKEKYSDDEEYEFYNILWVQHDENGIAYRAGCGRVMKEDWEINNPVRERIILG